MPVPNGEITSSNILKRELPKMVMVTCNHCAKRYEIAEENVRVDNQCTECK